MAELNLKSFDELYPIMIKKYQTLVTDPNASVLDKINSIITGLNATGKLTNDVVKNWNNVMQWAMSDGLTASVSAKLEDMFAKGELNALITSELSTKANQSDLDQTNTNIGVINQTLATKANQSDLNQTNANVLTNQHSIASQQLQINTNANNITNIGSGTPKGVYATLSALQTAFPTGTTGVYLVTADGNWYYWSGSNWVAGGLYQAVQIAPKSVSRPTLDDDLSTSVNQNWEGDPTILYAIADTNGAMCLSVGNDGTVTIYKLSLGLQSVQETAIQNNIDVDPNNSGIVWGITDQNNNLSELVIGQDGLIPQWVLNAWKQRMNGTATISQITSWGDSLTAGAGGNGTTYSSVLASLSGRTVNNNGVGGETSNTIASRQGGLAMVVNNFTIPADTTLVKIAGADTGINIVDTWGNAVYPLRQGSGNINPCTIAGVSGTLSITQTSSTSTDWQYFFQRTVAGSSVQVNRPTPIITNGMNVNRNDILVLFIGQNGGWANDQELIDQYKMMVDYNNNKNYIVLGLTSGTASSRQQLEYDMNQAFGRRYINLRDYLVKYGLQDAGLTATSQDTTDLSTGSVPTSLRVDGVHFNASGYTIIGTLIYNRMKELGIL